MRFVPLLALLAATGTAALAAKTLDIYFVDTEGGQSTLMIAPSGQTFLVDAGYSGNSGRDALRIAAAAKAAGVKRIDTLLITHFHSDHVGGVKNLLEKLPVATVVDKGASIETNGYPDEYAAAFAKAQHRVVAPGDSIAVKDLQITVVAAAAKNIQRAGEPNPFCAGVERRAAEQDGENPQSAAVVVEYGKFRFLDPGDLPYNRELSLLCPQNLVGRIDLYLTAHHGAESPRAISGMAPRVAIMNNGARKGGEPGAWRRVRETPGLEDLWQLHFAVDGGKDANAPDTMIANVDEQCQGVYLKVSASADGSFTVFNPRNKYMKTYAAK